jgi:N-ethylmaleimide reductase
VELHGANGYLPDQFLLEVVEALVSVCGADRAGARIVPGGTFNGMYDSNPTALFGYLAERLNRFGLAYLHIIEPRIKGNTLIAEGQSPVTAEQLPKIYRGKIIAAGGFQPGTAEEIVEKGEADLVAFGRHFLANPDLPRRIR